MVQKRIKYKNNYTLLHYFLSYFLIFSILILGFFFIMRSQLTNEYYKQLIAQSEEQLDHVTRQLKDDINSLEPIYASMRNNVDITLYRYKSDASYQYTAYTEIQKYTIGKYFIDSIVFLSKNHDFIISTNQHVDYRDQTFYLYSNATSQNTIPFSPADYADSGHNQLIYIENDQNDYLLWLPGVSSLDNFVSFTILNTYEIEQLCNSIASDAMPSVALVTADRQVVCGVNMDMLIPYMDSFDLTAGIYPLDNSSSLCVNTNISDGFVMLSLISNDTLLDQVNSAFLHTYNILLGLACIGLILVFISTRSTYRPLLRLTQKVIDKPNPSQSYLDQLDLAFEDSARQNHDLQEKLNKYKLTMQKSILDSIVTSNQPTDTFSLPDIDQFFNMDSDNYIFAVRIYAQQSPFPCDEILTFFQKSLSHKDCCVILEKQENTAVFLLNYSRSEPHKDEVLHLLLTNLYEEKGYMCAISNSSGSPMDIPSLYEHSIQASSFWDQTPVVAYRDVEAAVNNDSVLSYPHDALNSLSNSLRENNIEDASAHINELFRIINAPAASANKLPDFFVRCILIDMLASIANAMNNLKIRFNAFNELYFETLYYCRSFSYAQNRESIQKNIKQLLSFYKEQIDVKIISSYQFKQIMEECYCQPDFSIAVLADKFHVSDAYMSYLIKKETNQTFSDYLWGLRLTKAKERLFTTDQSVDEISLAVGYANPSSFRRKFKQETGRTPSQFRNEKNDLL